jgi:geranylgeranyl reductase family protein
MNISVIGAGPIGSIAARWCAQGHDTVIYEIQKNDARRVQCSGLLSRSGLERLGINPYSSASKRFIKNSVRGARIYSPSGKLLEINGGRDKAFVLDRREFDNYLLEKAMDSGAAFVNEKIDAKNLEKIRKGYDKMILATGTNYNLQRALKINIPQRFLYGAQYEMKLECDSDFVEMHLNVPGFFSWIIPVGEYCRVGLCARKNPVPYLDAFVRKLAKDGRIPKERIASKNFGIIPVYDPSLSAQYPGISLVGDAAGHVKATTGGGIILGGVAARYASDERYEKMWRREIGRELYMHLSVRRFLDRLSDKNLDKLITLLDGNRDIIENKGDMDMASNLLYGFVKSPKFMAKLISQAPGYFLDVIKK